MKKIGKIVLIIVAAAAVIGIISSFTDDDESSQTVAASTDIMISYVDTELGVIDKPEGSGFVQLEDFSDISSAEYDIVSDNTNVATVKFDSDDSSSTLYFTVTAIGEGDTQIYARAKDGSKESNKITVNVVSAIDPKEGFASLENGSLYDAMNTVKESGYTATYVHADSGLDYTENIAAFTEDELKNKWAVVDIVTADKDDKTVTISINTKENIAENEERAQMAEVLSEKLNSVTAWQAVKAYGEKQYIYGFDLHYILGVLAEEAEDENTWYLKAEVTITNEYNAEVEMTCEARVTGTDANPKVIDFSVY